MPDDKGEGRNGVRQGMAWTRLFEAFWIALLDPAKLLLAAIAIVVMYCGLAILAAIFHEKAPPTVRDSASNFSAANNPDADPAKLKAASDKVVEESQKPNAVTIRAKATEQFRAWPANQDRGPNPVWVVRHSTKSLLSYEFWRDQSPVLMEPMDKFVSPVFLLFDGNADVWTKFYAVLCLLWIFLTWAFFGGALTRMVAVQFARKEKVGPIEALTFAASKWLSYFLAPLFPLIVVLIIVLVMAVVAAILMNLYLDFLVGILYFLTLIGGIVMVLTLIGYAGWPIMYATISVEGSDTFDAVFRSYSYIYQRPWQYLGYALISLAYGAVAIFFVVFATSAMVLMAKNGVEKSDPVSWRETSVSTLYVYAPESYQWRDLLLNHQDPNTVIAQMNGYQKFSAYLTGFWLHLLFLLMLGFAYSYFWTSSTIIYFLLRKSVDGNDLDEVYLVEEEEPLPITPAGAAAPMKSPEPAVASLPMVEAPKPAPPAAATPAAVAVGSEKPPGGDGAPAEKPPAT